MAVSIPESTLAVHISVCINTSHLVQEDGDKVERPAGKSLLCHEFGFYSEDSGEPTEESKQAMMRPVQN